MADRPNKILLVEPDAGMLEILVACLARHLDVHITCVADAASCMDVEMLDPHDLVITEMTLPDRSGLDLVQDLAALSHRPVILLADEPTCEQAIEALRVGATDLFHKPFPVEHLLEAVDRSLRSFDVRRQRAAKYRRMRDLVRRVIRERRHLNQRIELVCRDLVEAQRRVVHRVLAIEEKNAQQAQ